MPNIDTTQYYDGVARTAGDTYYVRNGSTFTLRTDTRWHDGSPAGMTGCVDTIQIPYSHIGHVVVDGTKVRWMAFSSGAGSVPAIGTSITQGGISGVLLGVWASITSAPSAVGGAMPATGFLKFREVSGGTFAVGALTGISASADSADVVGWIEIVSQTTSAYNQWINGAGTFRMEGDFFDLGLSSGAYEQVVQMPTNGGGTNTYLPGVFVEESPGSNTYMCWPAVRSDRGYTTEWSIQRMAAPYMATDSRQQFVKVLSDGRVQFGEHFTYNTGTYAAAVSSTYTAVADNGVVYIPHSGHGLRKGERTYVTFAGGDAGFSGTYTIDDQLYSGFYITVPGISNGNKANTVYMRPCRVTRATHNMVVGHEVYVEFSANPSLNGNYALLSSSSTGYYDIMVPFAAATSGTVIEKLTIGHIPASGCRIKMPNIILQRTTSANRSLNLLPNSSCPSIYSGSSGSYGDHSFRYVCFSGWTLGLSQARSVALERCILCDSNTVNANDTVTFTNSGNTFHYYTPSSFYLRGRKTICTNSCISSISFVDYSSARYVYFVGCRLGSPYSVQVLTFCSKTKIEIQDCFLIASSLSLVNCSEIVIDDMTVSARMSGVSSNISAYTASTIIQTSEACHNLIIDGLVILQAPYSYLAQLTYIANYTIRNIGSLTSPCVIYDTGNNFQVFNIDRQSGTGLINRVYMYYSQSNTSPVAAGSTSADMVMSNFNIMNPRQEYSALPATRIRGARGKSLRGYSDLSLSEIYRFNWNDIFTSDTTGNVCLFLVGTDPEASELDSYSVTSGSLFSTGSTGYNGLTLQTSGDTCTWTMPYYALGYTGFANTAATLAGQNTGNFTIEYQLDPGTGSWGEWTAYSAVNLSAETISPSAGFKLRFRITANASNYNNVLMHIYTPMVTTFDAQRDNLYPMVSELAETFDLYAPASSLVESYSHPVACNIVSSESGAAVLTSSDPRVTVPDTANIIDGRATFDAVFSEPCTARVTATLGTFSSFVDIESAYYPESLSVGPDYTLMGLGFPYIAKFAVVSNLKWNTSLPLTITDVNIEVAGGSVSLVDGIGEITASIIGPCSGTISATTPNGTTGSCFVEIIKTPPSGAVGPIINARIKI